MKIEDGLPRFRTSCLFTNANFSDVITVLNQSQGSIPDHVTRKHPVTEGTRRSDEDIKFAI